MSCAPSELYKPLDLTGTTVLITGATAGEQPDDCADESHSKQVNSLVLPTSSSAVVRSQMTSLVQLC